MTRADGTPSPVFAEESGEHGDNSGAGRPRVPLTLGARSRIFLIGLRGSGKTTIARLLARELNWSWIDGDDLIEQTAGKSIREIFANDGEAAFRTQEAAALVQLSQCSRHVIATGGGVVLRPENRD